MINKYYLKQNKKGFSYLVTGNLGLLSKKKKQISQ